MPQLIIPNAPGSAPTGNPESWTDEQIAARIRELEQGQGPTPKGPGLPPAKDPFATMSDAEIAARSRIPQPPQDVGHEYGTGLKEFGAYTLGAPFAGLDWASRAAGALDMRDPAAVKATTAGLQPYEGEAWRRSLLSPEERMPPQNVLGDFARTLGRNTPAVLGSLPFGAEGLAALTARTLGSTIGEVGARRAAQKWAPETAPWAGLAGALGGWKLGGGFPAAPERVADVAALRGWGANVSAARQSGSRLASMLEGGPGDWGQQVRQAQANLAAAPVGISKKARAARAAAVQDLGEAGERIADYPDPLIDPAKWAGTAMGLYAAKHGMPGAEVAGTFVVPDILKVGYRGLTSPMRTAPVQAWMRGFGPPMNYTQAALSNIPAMSEALSPPPRLMLPPPPNQGQ